MRAMKLVADYSLMLVNRVVCDVDECDTLVFETKTEKCEVQACGVQRALRPRVETCHVGRRGHCVWNTLLWPIDGVRSCTETGAATSACFRV